MKIGDNVKIISDLDMNGNSSDNGHHTHLTDYIGMNGKIMEMTPSRSYNRQKGEFVDITVQFDDKYFKNGEYGQFIGNLCTSISLEIYNLEIIDEEVNVFDRSKNKPLSYPKNMNIKRGGDKFSALDISKDVMFTGNLYSIVNEYIMETVVEGGWDDKSIDEVLNLKTKQQVSDFLYNKMEIKIQ